MFDDLYDAVSYLSNWRWPAAGGQITAVDVDRRRGTDARDNMRLCVAYEFSIGDDGPYTGESFSAPAFFRNRRVVAARRKFRIRKPVRIRYRPDDPSVNKLDRSAWSGL
jgi:hypothetical protein